MSGWKKMTARHSTDSQLSSGDYAREDTYATCPECLRQVKVGRGNRLASHTIPNTVFLCDGSNYLVKDIKEQNE